MDGMAAMIRLEDSIISHTLRLQEYLHSANITEDDLDYYFNYTGLLPTHPGGMIPKTGVSPTAVLAGDILTVEEDPVIETEASYDGCGMGLHKIRPSVHLVHGVLSLIICVAGCLANIVNIVVLSRRELRRNAINRILCSLAVADFLLMLEYIPFACHMYLFPGRSLESFYTYPWAVFVLFHAHFTLVRITCDYVCLAGYVVCSFFSAFHLKNQRIESSPFDGFRKISYSMSLLWKRILWSVVVFFFLFVGRGFASRDRIEE